MQQDRRSKEVLDDKTFHHMSKFDGSLADWDEWKHKLIMACGKDPELARCIQDTMAKAGLTHDLQAIRVDQERLDKYSMPLYRIISMITEKEANLVVRNAKDRAGYCGFAALCLLSQRFNPKTPGRVLQHLTDVLSPKPVKDVRHLQRAVEEWEAKRARLKAEFDEEFSDNISIAILTSMLPRDLQDIVFQQGQIGEELKYRTIRDKMMSIANDRSLMTSPTPMDIGCLGEPMLCEEASQEEGEWREVDAVTNKTCYACGGWGHLARECPTQAAKGKGKPGSKGGGKFGGKALGKGAQVPNGKGTAPGKGWMSKGEGKGYQGVCFRCNVVGHKAHECTAQTPTHWSQQVSEVAVAPPMDTTAVSCVGGLWSISAVCQEEDPTEGWHLVRGRRGKQCRAEAMPKVVQPTGKDPKINYGQFETLMLCTVGEEDEKVSGGNFEVCGLATEITVDSAAEESVCPLRWADHFGLNPVQKGRELKLVNASGGRINHSGSRQVVVHPDSGGRTLEMGFQVTDVKKPLLAVSRLCDKGNVVQFGPESHHNFVMNVTTGEKLHMKRRGNSWVLAGDFSEAGHF